MKNHNTCHLHLTMVVYLAHQPCYIFTWFVCYDQLNWWKWHCGKPIQVLLAEVWSLQWAVFNACKCLVGVLCHYLCMTFFCWVVSYFCSETSKVADLCCGLWVHLGQVLLGIRAGIVGWPNGQMASFLSHPMCMHCHNDLCLHLKERCLHPEVHYGTCVAWRACTSPCHKQPRRQYRRSTIIKVT